MMKKSNRYSRQTFLGDTAQDAISAARIGIIGLGGGGSHIVQQLAHLGFLRYCLYDPDRIEFSNLNRLVGGNEADATQKALKVDIARRVILGVQSAAEVEAISAKWQERPEPLKRCDIVFGCVDGVQQRRELEQICRRYLIPYIDIGLDVHPHPEIDGAPALTGQVMLSVPGHSCLWCYNYLSEGKISAEVAKYGAAGINPQVVWANGILASTAVGLAVNLLTNWTKDSPKAAYLAYNGNTLTLKPHERLELGYVPATCTHYNLADTGDPIFKKL